MSDNEEQVDPEIQNLLNDLDNERDARDEGQTTNTTTTTNESEFRVTVFHKNGIDTLRKRFRSYDTVATLAQAITDEVTGGPDADTSHRQGRRRRMRIIYRRVVLEWAETLEHYKLTAADNNGTSPTVNVVFNVDGGAALSEDEKSNNNNYNNNKYKRKRLPDFKNEKRIKPTLKPDCIMGYDEKKLRVKMPCGHVFDSHTIYNIGQMTILSHNKNKIRCPMLKCNKIWEIDIVKAAADLNEKEELKFKSILSKRELINSCDFCECKGCKRLMARPDDLKKIRVRCSSPECSRRRDFCWMCQQEWKGGGFQVCGNNNCRTKDINDVLQNCRTITTSGKVCPEMRHCPKCLNLIIWDQACKHMTCWGCNQQFCFVCLKLRDPSKGWQCSDCTAAPRQRLK